MKRVDKTLNKARGKALFLHSDATGNGWVDRHAEKVVARLGEIFESVEQRHPASVEELRDEAIASCGVYDALIVSGGDGTFNNVVSALLGRDNAPTLGYINGGTMSDVGKNFGVHGSISRALRIIEEGHTTGFDVISAGDRYAVYMAAVGAYADIAYVTKRNRKKRFGRLSYYSKAVQEAFMPKKYIWNIRTENGEYEGKTPFVLCLNGRYVGGFPVNRRKSGMHDGKFELYLTKPGLFNGLVHYLFFKARTVQIEASECHISTSCPDPWCLDGEMAGVGELTLRCIDSGLRVFCDKKYAEAE